MGWPIKGLIVDGGTEALILTTPVLLSSQAAGESCGPPPFEKLTSFSGNGFRHSWTRSPLSPNPPSRVLPTGPVPCPGEHPERSSHTLFHGTVMHMFQHSYLFFPNSGCLRASRSWFLLPFYYGDSFTVPNPLPMPGPLSEFSLPFTHS